MNKFLFSVLIGSALLIQCREPIEPSEPTELERLIERFEQKPGSVADGCQLPVGNPPGKNYFDANPFRTRSPRFSNQYHLGEDWNRRGVNDFGDPVYAACNGLVDSAVQYGGGWGKVLRIIHRFPDGSLYESLYAHLHTMEREPGTFVRRGERIGTIGDAEGAYPAHLHLEFRDKIWMDLGGGYACETAGWISPSDFIKANAPRANTGAEK